MCPRTYFKQQGFYEIACASYGKRLALHINATSIFLRYQYHNSTSNLNKPFPHVQVHERAAPIGIVQQ